VPHVSLERVTWNSVLGTSFLVGFIEEIPYRGFMLQKFTARTGFWPANLITSLLFLRSRGIVARRCGRCANQAASMVCGVRPRPRAGHRVQVC
jgi:hypothetical protein